MIPRTLLIVDDSEIDRSFLRELFADNYQIIEAADGAQALEIMRTQCEKISAVILDIMMPNVDGMEVLRTRQGNKRLQLLPVVVVAALNSIDDEIRSLENGATDVIYKPYDARIIKHRVANAVEKYELEKQKIAHTEELLNETMLRLSALLDNIPGGVVTFDYVGQLRTLYYNDTLPQMVGYSREEFDRLFLLDASPLFHSMDLPQFISTVEQTIAQNKANTQFNCDVRFACKDGTRRWFKINATYIGRQNDRPMFHAVFLDIHSEKIMAEERRLATVQLQYRIDHDPLTGIYNREAFCARTSRMLRENVGRRYILMYWNIERFKFVNDIFGTKTGNDVLKKVARDLDVNLRADATYGRLGSDHFAVCCPHDRFSVEKIVRKIDEGFDVDFHLTFNVGIYEIEDITMAVDKMCDRAALAAQTVKGNAIVHFAFYDERLRSEQIKVQEIIGNMQHSLDEHYFEVFYQPVYSISGNCPVSAEALVRWKRPDGGLVSPTEFIPLFEQNGFIAKLDCYVWETVCRYLRTLLDGGIMPLPVSVNVSRRSLYRQGLDAELIALLQKYDISPQLVRLEITESAYSDNPARMLQVISELRRHHFTVLMDDFGSGYSSLNILKDTYFDMIKLDMRFLEGATHDNRAGRILLSVIHMARLLEMPVIAEGVETREELELLRGFGCDRIQGYYYSQPLPSKEFEKHCYGRVVGEENA